MFQGSPMIDPRMAQQMMQGGVGGPSPMGGPQMPPQIMPQQAPQSMQGMPPGGLGQMMQDPRIQAYLQALQGRMG